MSSKSLVVMCTLILALMGALLLYGKARAVGSEPRLEILNESLAVATHRGSDAENAAVVTVRNNGAELTGLRFRVVNETAEHAAPVRFLPEKAEGAEPTDSWPEPPASIELDAYSVKQFVLRFAHTEKAQAGYLILEGAGVTPAVCPLEITPAVETVSIAFLGNIKPSVGGIIVSGLLLGCLLVILALVGVIVRKKKSSRGDQERNESADEGWTLKEIFSSRMMAELDWDFTKNWGSTFTLVGAFFVTLGGAALMPEKPQLLSSQAYQVVILSGPGLISIAPMVVAALNSLGSEMAIKLKDGRKRLITVGDNAQLPVLIVPFFVGSAFVVWAVTSELATLLVYLRELELAKALPPEVVASGQWGVLVLWVIGFYYAWERIVQAAESAGKRQKVIDDEQKKYEQSLIDPWGIAQEEHGIELPQPGWPSQPSFPKWQRPIEQVLAPPPKIFLP